MKKNLVAILLSCLAFGSLRADVVFRETFNYPDGSINFVSTNGLGGTNWLKHSGAADDALVVGHKLQVAMSRAADVNRPFNNGFTNSVTNLYASFTVNCTNVPTTSNYFAHFFRDTSTFHARTWNASGSLSPPN